MDIWHKVSIFGGGSVGVAPDIFWVYPVDRIYLIDDSKYNFYPRLMGRIFECCSGGLEDVNTP